MGRRLVLLVVVALLALPGGASAATLGEQRILLMLTTWGPEPYAPGVLRAELDEAGSYMRSVSYGKTWLVGDVTAWLHALSARPRCDTNAIAAAAQRAATAAGYEMGRYTLLGIALPHLDACPWGGSYYPPGIWLNGLNNREVIVHELGHTYGVPEEGLAWRCASGRCNSEPYLSPFSVMGHGSSDYSAWEKHVFGWLDQVAEPAPQVTIGAIDREGPHPQALRVVVAGDEYWLEYRPPAPVWGFGAPDAAPGVAVYAGANGLLEPSRFSERSVLLYDPAGHGRPAVQAGEAFAVRRVFTVRVSSAGADSATLAFRWTDRTRPGRPVVRAAVAGSRLVVRWRRGLERGSGIAAHEVFADGRRVARIDAVRPVAGLLVRNDDRVRLRLQRGMHRVAVVAIDRAGNRSRVGTRRVRVP
jgi:hypothetical protein